MSRWVCPLLKAEDDWTFQETADLGADFHLINSFNDKWFAASDNPYELIELQGKLVIDAKFRNAEDYEITAFLNAKLITSKQLLWTNLTPLEFLLKANEDLCGFFSTERAGEKATKSELKRWVEKRSIHFGGHRKLDLSKSINWFTSFEIHPKGRTISLF